MGGRWNAFGVERDPALPALGRMVVREGSGNAGRTKKNVVVLEECRKGAPGAVTLSVEPEPVAVRQSIPAHHQIEIGLVTGTNCLGSLAPALDIFLRRARRRGRAQQQDVHL